MSSQLARVRSQCAAKEQDLDGYLNQKKSHMQQKDIIRAREGDETERHTSVSANQNTQHTAILATISRIAEATKRRQDDAVSKRERRLQLSLRILEIQQTEGHEQSIVSPESNSPPVLDIDRIRRSFQAESDAVKAEIDANAQISAELETIRSELSVLRTGKSTCDIELSAMKSANDTCEMREAERKATNNQLLAEIKRSIAAIDEKNSAMNHRQMDLDAEQKILTIDLESTTRELAEGENQDEARLRVVSETEEYVADLQHSFDQLKLEMGTKRQTKENDLSLLQQRTADLQDELGQRIQESDRQSNREHQKLVRKAERSIAEKIEGKQVFIPRRTTLQARNHSRSGDLLFVVEQNSLNLPN
jgi:hypothetical protein